MITPEKLDKVLEKNPHPVRSILAKKCYHTSYRGCINTNIKNYYIRAINSVGISTCACLCEECAKDYNSPASSTLEEMSEKDIFYLRCKGNL